MSISEATITVEISPGELIDKITILEIKADRIGDSQKRANVLHELKLLKGTCQRGLPGSPMLEELTSALKSVNEDLWEIEDDIRDCERRRDFGAAFVALARSVYITNDKRAALKRKINQLLGSQLVEEKSYTPY